MSLQKLEKYGFVSYSVNNDPSFDDEGNEYTGNDYVLIDLVFVKPEFRSQGYAKKLVLAAIDEIKVEHNGLDIKLYALPKEKDIELEGLVDLYESCGFSIDKDAVNSDGVVMVL